jgi:hypothetical protein
LSATGKHFQIANPNVVASLVKASETTPIIAALDIYDIHGTKLWAATQAVSRGLQDKLLARKLRDPIETCLRSEKSVGTEDLATAAREFAESEHPLAPGVKPHLDELTAEISQLTIHPVIALLLSVARLSMPTHFKHAITGMCVAGSMYKTKAVERCSLQLALLGGLLHDIGYLYLHPMITADDAPEDAQTYKQIVAHPRIGRLLIEELTDYPHELAVAIDEHHERLDGSGYPAATSGSELSPLGRLLAVAEVLVSVATGDSKAAKARALLALRFVTVELDQSWTTQFQVSDEELNAAAGDSRDPKELARQVALIPSMLDAVQSECQDIVKRQGNKPRTAGGVAQLALRRATKLRTAWAETGLWALPAEGASDAEAKEPADAPALVHEMRFRLRQLQREIIMRSADLPDGDAADIYRLRDLLSWPTE